ncbi:hypothetical protein NXC12_CH01046 [Rhizobium etli]|uniref:Uncharacterized protein n=1 Tax=Rhizobium etli TaxID=29449 RepID=A0AAN1BD22_RHIET|nr:hypothetical protein NXC12_CH01046 [Rhizobium etli]
MAIVTDHYPALAFQARQLLKYKTTEQIFTPLVIDVFALDAITEMLEMPLRLLSYQRCSSTRSGETRCVRVAAERYTKSAVLDN